MTNNPNQFEALSVELDGTLKRGGLPISNFKINGPVEGKEFSGRYLIRGVNSTGYSSVTVLDTLRGGFCQLRTHPDVGNATINTITPGKAGQELYIKIDNDTDGNKTITFGTPFKVTGTMTGSTAASAILHFISDGTSLWEVSRTTGLAT